jgi:hypothetical protein
MAVPAYKLIAPYSAVPNVSIVYNGVSYVVGSTLHAPAGTTIKVGAYVKNINIMSGTAWMGVVRGAAGTSFLDAKVITKSIGAGMTGYLSFDVEMPSSDYNACISCGRYANGSYYEHDEKCCIRLVPESTTTCAQYFLVKDKNTGSPISPAKVSGAGKISFTTGSGSATLVADKNSTNYVSVGMQGYISQTKLITWLCNYTQVFEMVPEGATPEKSTTLKWDGSPPTSAGVDQEVIFKFKLVETSNDKAVYGETVELAVNGYHTNVKRVTNSYGKVSLPYKFKTTGTHKVYGLFEANFPYKGDTSTEKEIKVTAPKSAYAVTAHELPGGKTYIVKAFEGTSIYWDPAKAYQVTSLNKTCDILRSDMTTPGTSRTIKLFDENGKQIYKTPKPIRALKSTNDILAVNVYANEGKEYRINMSNIPDTPAVNEAFDIEAKLIIGQSTPAGAGQSIIFKEEVTEGQYSEIGKRNTNDFGVAKYQHSGKAEEGSYKFIAVFEHGEASCNIHTVTVGGEPSGFEDFLVPLFKWVQEVFDVDEKTAKTYTYVGIGVFGLVVLGGFLK